MSDSIVPSNSLEISELNGELVVDSRLIATRLGVKHKATMQLIRNNIDDLKDFGVLPFEMAKLEEGSTGRPETFCYLNEDQSTYLMTLSKNTEQVKLCKKQLVQAFSAAKQIIKTVIPAQNDRIRELELENENLKLKQGLIDRQDVRLALHGLQTVLMLEGRPDAVVTIEVPVMEVLDINNGTSHKFLSTDQLKSEVSKRVGQKLKTGKVFTDALKKAGRDDLMVAVTRPVTAEYVIPDRLDEAIQVVYQSHQQVLLGT